MKKRRIMSQILSLLYGTFALCLPLIGTALVPNGYQRIGAAAFAVVGLGTLVSFFGAVEPSSFATGLMVGFILATLKLALGIRVF